MFFGNRSKQPETKDVSQLLLWILRWKKIGIQYFSLDLNDIFAYSPHSGLGTV